jgi:hypothetical protein
VKILRFLNGHAVKRHQFLLMSGDIKMFTKTLLKNVLVTIIVTAAIKKVAPLSIKKYL